MRAMLTESCPQVPMSHARPSQPSQATAPGTTHARDGQPG